MTAYTKRITSVARVPQTSPLQTKRKS